MEKSIMTGIPALASVMMASGVSYAQVLYKTVADVPMVQLNNGVLMPQFGIGTFNQPSDYR